MPGALACTVAAGRASAPETWALFLDAALEGKLTQVDDMRDAGGAWSKFRGKSLNSKDLAELARATAHALINPTVIFEVVSNFTAAYDAGEKFDHYARLPSLQQYVLVDSERVHVYVYTRGEGGTWVRMGHAEGEMVPLRSVDIVLSMAEIYEGWAEERVIDAGG